MDDPELDAMSAALSKRLVGVRASLTLEDVAADEQKSPMKPRAKNPRNSPDENTINIAAMTTTATTTSATTTTTATATATDTDTDTDTAGKKK